MRYTRDIYYENEMNRKREREGKKGGKGKREKGKGKREKGKEKDG